MVRINQVHRFVTVLVSASAIIGSTVIMPINVLAVADVGVETSAPQSICEAECPSPITVVGEDSALAPATSDTPLVATSIEDQNLPDLLVATVETQPELAVDTTASSDLTVNTTALQDTQSGDATVTGTDTAGDATTGQAEASVILENQANTITSLGDNEVTLLSGPVDISGPIVINPQSSSNNQAIMPIANEDVTVIDNTTAISNVVVVDSTSGSATIANNETVGNIATGDAISNVSILNMANHIVSTGDIFIGNITVYGDLSKDIMLSQALLSYLLNGTTPSSTVFSSDVDVSSLQVITNNVSVAATSGAISAEYNETIGDAKTGNAESIVLIKNMAGSYTLYGNSLLILINVTGNWNGGILGNNTSIIAALSASPGGIAVSTLSNTSSDKSAISINNKTSITNTVTASAKSGDINASNNEGLGSMTTGNAKVTVQILNIANTIVSFSDWLGVLFVNIFGDWDGGIVMQQALVPEDESANVVANSTNPIAPVSATPTVEASRPISASTVSAQAEAATPPAANTIVAAEETTELPSVNPIITASSTSSSLWLVIVLLFTGGLLAGNGVFSFRQ